MQQPAYKVETIGPEETIASKHNKGGEYDYSTPTMLIIHVGEYTKIVYINNPGNCKIGTVMRVQDAMYNDATGTIRRLKELFATGSRKFGFKVTFNNLASVKAVAKHFEPLYIVKVPMVEAVDHQYHAMFWTGRTDGPSFQLYKNRIAREEVEVLLNTGGKKKAKVIGTKKLTEAHIDKIQSYKSRYHLTKYVEKLINGENL